ncbi:MAG: DUF423 domain-containing protein [Pseudomonadota bacterium]|nr:DUF423 domain-containing protein [Pseudomonadota bacterium]
MWLIVAAINLALAVMFGAFGAHAVKARVSVEQLGWWQTATDYFFWHALGLLIIGVLARVQPEIKLNSSAVALQIGIIIFCGSLYLMALGSPRWFGAITPIGGLAFIIGWILLAVAAWRSAF